MTRLKVGRHNYFVEDFRDVISPTSDGPGCVAIVFRNGDREPFQGEEAETIRAWLDGPTEPPAPISVPITTKVDAKVSRK